MATQEFADFEIQTDFTNTPVMSGEFNLLPAGTYKVVVRNVKQETAKESQNPMVVVTFEVLEALAVPGLDDEGLLALVGQKIWNNYVIIDKTLGRLKSLMVATRATLTSFRAAEILEAELIIDVIHNLGKSRVSADGTPEPAKVFSNVVNERPIDEEPAAPVEPPPVTKGAAAKGAAKPANGASRRA